MRVPVRCCVACRKREEKKKLIRVVIDDNGYATADIRQNKDGRGAYLCKDSGCIDTARKRHSVERALKCRVSEEFYTSIKEMTDEQT